MVSVRSATDSPPGRALGEKGGPPFCPSCGERLFTSALKELDAVYIEPEPETAAPLARPKPTRGVPPAHSDDLDAHRAQTSGTDFTFERLRIQGPGYNLFVVVGTLIFITPIGT